MNNIKELPGGTLIKNLAPDEKPREKAMTHGIEALTSTELLAIIFGSGLKGKSVIELSREILADVDNRLDRLAQMSIEALSSRYSGIGPAKAISLAASIELGRRCQRDLEARGRLDPAITSSETVYKLMRTNLELLDNEEFWILYLNRGNRVIARERVSIGGVTGTVVDVKVIMKHALDRLASGLILVHNHPSGTLKPSGADDSITTKISAAASFFDISVLDHVIIGAGGFYSYRDEGKI